MPATRFSLNLLLNIWKKLAGHGVYVAVLDAVLLFFAVYLGYAIRLTLFIPQANLIDCLYAAGVFVFLNLSIFAWGRQYKILWTHAGLEDYIRFVRLYFVAAILFMLGNSWWRFALLPRTSLVIMLFAGLVFCGMLRVSFRLAHPAIKNPSAVVETLIVGAGEAGVLLARDLLRSPEDLRLLGFVDDDPLKYGKNIAGLGVLGKTSELPLLIEQRGVKVVLVAIPSADGKKIRAIYDLLAPLNIEVRVLPSLRELAGGRISFDRLRRIRLEDLLGREPVKINTQEIAAYLRGRTVLVTGAGGSIGSEIVRQVLLTQPKEIVLLGHGEQSIYTLTESLIKLHLTVPLHSVIADVADSTAMREVFKAYQPQVVFHAAAHKHVPLMENSPREALRVNGRGTQVVAELCGEYGTEKMVLISTDKAVNPSSVMGASKRVAELILEEVQKRSPATSYMAVRFGNVLGSRGSVIPKFEEQIASGGPLTVTDPAMKRYFMLIPEAVSLVIQAGAMGQGGELFVLDMGEPVLIYEMAEMLIRLHGYKPHKDIAITFTGVRPGEKLFEELFYNPDAVLSTGHPKVFSTSLSFSHACKTPVSELLSQSLAAGDVVVVLELLRQMVPEYAPLS